MHILCYCLFPEDTYCYDHRGLRVRRGSASNAEMETSVQRLQVEETRMRPRSATTRGVWVWVCGCVGVWVGVYVCVGGGFQRSQCMKVTYQYAKCLTQCLHLWIMQYLLQDEVLIGITYVVKLTIGIAVCHFST